MGDYLEAYADRFQLPVRSGVEATRLERASDGVFFVIATKDGSRIRARQVIVATGPFRKPFTPAFAKELDPAIHQIHSHAYRDASTLRDGPVLVVGLAHSGGDIAYEVAPTHRTILSGKAAGQVPFRVIETPRDRLVWPIIVFVFGHLLTIRTPMGRRIRAQIRGGQGGGAPLIRVRLPDLDAAGIERHDARTVGVRDGKPMLADGEVLDVANVIWCTGYDRIAARVRSAGDGRAVAADGVAG